ncbi:MAG TPA: enoyl-CoA hydratase [Caulobacteraceae bacterium]|nr:enoyl-CoA hydratase [Caulobacteraceae bacterium]
MPEPILLSRLDGPVARLTLNDPDRANVLSEAMMAALADALSDLAADPAVRVVVLGAAGKVFCAGHDLAELQAANDAGAALFGRCSALMQAIVASPKPVIARVQGAAVAAGCQLAASCDLAFSVDTARFAVSGINLGLFCSTPGVALGRAVGRKDALEMLLTGRFVGAAEAAAMGLINRAVPAAELDAVIDETALAIAAKAPDAIALGKSVFHRQIELPLQDAYAVASAAMAENLGFESAEAGIAAFLKR